MSIVLEIDGKKVKAKAGMMVLQAAKKAGIYIPTLCDHPLLEPAGNCRLCMVEIKGRRGYPTACTTPVEDGMVVKTNSDQLNSLRRNILQLTLSEHPYTCLVCDKRNNCDDYQKTIRKVGVTTGCQYCPQNGSCELQNLVEYLKLDTIEFPISYRKLPVEQDDPFFDRDYNLCILCGRCVRVCNEVRNKGVLTFINRGDRTIVGTAFHKSHLEAGCEFCGACVDVCPTGALYDKRSKWEGVIDTSISSLCPYCSVGCSLDYNLKDSEFINTTPTLNSSVNLGQACMRGRFGITEQVQHSDRLKNPMIKKEERWIETSWDKALSLIAEKFLNYKEEEFGCIVSPHNTTEDMFLLHKLTRETMHSSNIALSSLCSQNQFHTALLELQRAHIPLATWDDLVKSKLLVIWGGDISDSHPIAAFRVAQAQNAGTKLIVVDFRKSKLADKADLFVQIHPDSDRILIAGLLKMIKERNNLSGKGSQKIEKIIEKVDLSWVSKKTGISGNILEDLDALLRTCSSLTFLIGPDIALQKGVKDTLTALGDLVLSLEKGKLLPVVGESNLRGWMEIGDTDTNITDIINNMEAGKIKCLYAAGELPQVDCIAKLDFLVVQSVFPPPYLKEADLILPASHLMERDGTIINLEGRVQRVKSAVKAHINTKPDWWISSKIIQKIKRTDPEYKNTSEIFKEIARSFPAFKGLSSQKLGKGGKYLARSKIKDTDSTFIPFAIKGKSGEAGKSYPYTLMFGWNLLSYRNGAFTETIADMEKVLPESKVEISPEDAKKAGVKNGETVLLKFPDGLLIYRMVKITSRVKDKTLYTWLGRNDVYGRLVKGNVNLVNIEKGTYEQNN